MKGAAQVDGQDRVPALGRKVLNARHVLDAGVVHQNIDRAKGGLGVAHHIFDFGGFAHVSAVVADGYAIGGNFGLGAFDVAKAVHHDIGALGGQGFGQTEANAAGGAGNEGGFAFEHGSVPCV